MFLIFSVRQEAGPSAEIEGGVSAVGAGKWSRTGGVNGAGDAVRFHGSVEAPPDVHGRDMK